MDTKVGFIGLGTMGHPMALNLLKAGYALTVFNRTASRMQPLVEAGARAASSPAEAAAQNDVIITMVPDAPEVREVLLPPHGALAGAHPSSYVVDMSTIAPSAAIELAAECTARGVKFVDAPVSGGERGAVEGTLSIMVGGAQEDFETLKPLFDVLGATITHCGPAGSGQAVKAVNQVVCGLNLLAVAEGLALAERQGLDLGLVLRVITRGAAGSWMLSNLGPKIAAGDYSPGFKIKHQQKDLRIALATGRQTGQPLPGTALVNQLYAAVEAAGGSEQGTQALIQTLRALAHAKES